MKKLIIYSIVALLSFNVASCSDDDLGATIFDTTEYPLDRTVFTFPLDTFLKVNFQEPYNLRYLYKLQDIGSDMDYNLIPCSYEQSVNLAVLNKDLWYDVYKKIVGEQFLKKYSPRVIHLIGSPAYNPTSGTITLGTAEGGLKITLYNAENLTPDNLEMTNEYFFKTMHHEFGHILNQNENRPTEFDLISNTFYNTAGWQDTPDSVALGQGFVSKYASSQAREDWVEVIANYIVKDTVTWENMLNGATKSWELATDVPAERFASYFVNGTTSVDADPTTWRLKPGIHRDSVGYWHRNGTTSGDVVATYQVVRKYIQRDASGYAVPDAEGNIVYLSIVDKTNQENGRDVILKKLQMTREWLMERFNYDLDAVRYEVQRRQYMHDDNDKLMLDEEGKPVNKLTYVRADGTTLLEELRQEVEKYKALMP